ncbi:MAG: sigma-70 family RNA polymerase sigma factor [Bryobacterales bacterium]|nr:sigma-70 family RNA polymerase sigma factor [Bryobacterales bacterium]
MSGTTEAIALLLRRSSSGDATALEELMPLVYDHLRRQAHNYLAGERKGHTLHSTDLVHEAFLKLFANGATAQDRSHFLALAARAMRQILVDHARGKRRQKRGGGAAQVTLHEGVLVSAEPDAALLDLDEALERLAAQDERKARVVELLHFGGLTYDETCLALGISATTLHREFSLAKAWLARDLKGAGSS